MTLPRALVGAVMGMARPRRPASEVQAVRDAAAAIRAEMGLTSAKALGREVAKRVTDQMLADSEHDPMEAILSGLIDCDPIATLASSPELGTLDELAELFRDRMLSHFGLFIPPQFQQQVQRRSASLRFRATLSERYAKHLRGIL